jgi:hypothetical protein
MSNPNAMIALYNTHAAAEEGIKTLSNAGFDMKKLSIIGKGYHTEEHPFGFYTVGDRIKTWGSVGSFWGGVWGLMVGPAVFFIPYVGVIAAAGPIVMSLVAALEGAVIVGGLSALGAALYGMGLSKDQVIKYESDIKADKFLLVVHGSAEEIIQGKAIIDRTQAADSMQVSPLPA